MDKSKIKISLYTHLGISKIFLSGILYILNITGKIFGYFSLKAIIRPSRKSN